MWEEASCYKSLGEAAKQRELLLALKANPQYKDRVDAELEVAEVANNSMRQHAARAAHARAAPAAAAAPPPQVQAAAPVEAKPQSSSGSSGKAVAAPKKQVDNASGF